MVSIPSHTQFVSIKINKALKCENEGNVTKWEQIPTFIKECRNKKTEHHCRNCIQEYYNKDDQSVTEVEYCSV